MMKKIDSLDLRAMETGKAVFFQTADNCYFITFFASGIITLGSPKVKIPIIKDFYQNKAELGRRAYLGRTMESHDREVSIGNCFGYANSGGQSETTKINEIIFGEYNLIEKHFLEAIKKMLKLEKKGNLNKKFTAGKKLSIAMAS